ncbi:MAG TPA: hypothetical protein VHI78_02660 [Bacteroidales bacterium]|nr:hypothetical protein [Bacteroidales bacterium]
MIQFLFIVILITAISLLLLGINIYVFGKKFPETEVGKNRNIMRLGLTCPSCEERAHYRKVRPVKIDVRSLKPDWKQINRTARLP